MANSLLLSNTPMSLVLQKTLYCIVITLYKSLNVLFEEQNLRLLHRQQTFLQ